MLVLGVGAGFEEQHEPPLGDDVACEVGSSADDFEQHEEGTLASGAASLGFLLARGDG